MLPQLISVGDTGVRMSAIERGLDGKMFSCIRIISRCHKSIDLADREYKQCCVVDIEIGRLQAREMKKTAGNQSVPPGKQHATQPRRYLNDLMLRHIQPATQWYTFTAPMSAQLGFTFWFEGALHIEHSYEQIMLFCRPSRTASWTCSRIEKFKTPAYIDKSRNLLMD